MIYTLIIPVYNEKNIIETTYEKIKYLTNMAEIIFVDDGSTDGTCEFLENVKNIKLIKNQHNLGKGSSIVKALNNANGKYVILFDGDLEIDPNEIKKIISKHEIDRTMVYKGSRLKSRLSDFISPYNYANKIINFFFNLTYNTYHNDVLCCLIVIEKKLLQSLNIYSKRFGLETEIMSKIALKEVHFEEVNVMYNRRKSSQGKKLTIFDAYDIIKVIISVKYS